MLSSLFIIILFIKTVSWSYLYIIIPASSVFSIERGRDSKSLLPAIRWYQLLTGRIIRTFACTNPTSNIWATFLNLIIVVIIVNMWMSHWIHCLSLLVPIMTGNKAQSHCNEASKTQLHWHWTSKAPNPQSSPALPLIKLASYAALTVSIGQPSAPAYAFMLCLQGPNIVVLWMPEGAEWANLCHILHYGFIASYHLLILKISSVIPYIFLPAVIYVNLKQQRLGWKVERKIKPFLLSTIVSWYRKRVTLDI